MLALLVWYLRKKAAELYLCMAWNTGIAPFIPNLGSRCRWAVRFTPWAPLTSEDDHLLSFIRTMRGAPKTVRMLRRGDKYVLNCRESKYGSLDVQPVDWSLYDRANRSHQWCRTADCWTEYGSGKRMVRAFDRRKGTRDRHRTYNVHHWGAFA